MYFFKIANTILNILQWIAGALLFHHFIFGILGIFTRKTFPKTQEKLKYGVIIPARNEEEVVGQLIESVKNNNYPTEKLHVFVIAHNCTDKTAEVARNLGATVYEYNNPEECTMGYAFRYLFKKIKEDYGIENYDGFFLFNADNVLDENFFSRMNDAFVAEDRKSVITSYRNSKNFGANAISACYGLYFILGSALESRGRTSVGCSTRVQGTGYVIPPEIVKDGWNYVTLTEDWEFTSDRIMNDTKIVYCDDAIFYDEQPTTLKVTCRQRLRWAKGHLLVCVTRLKQLLKSLFTSPKKGGGKHKISIYDITAYILPLLAISVGLSALSLVLFFANPEIYTDADTLFASLTSGAISFGFTCLYSYFTTLLIGLIIYIKEGKRIKNVTAGMKILSLIVFPFFMMLSIPLEIIAVFKKDIGWKVIPHSDQTTFDELNQNTSKVAKTENNTQEIDAVSVTLGDNGEDETAQKDNNA